MSRVSSGYPEPGAEDEFDANDDDDRHGLRLITHGALPYRSSIHQIPNSSMMHCADPSPRPLRLIYAYCAGRGGHTSLSSICWSML